MDLEGKVYSLGWVEYGWLGFGEGVEEKSIFIFIFRLFVVFLVVCGVFVGYVVIKDGCVFVWGMGINY